MSNSIEWSERAKGGLRKTLNYWSTHNKSPEFSDTLLAEVNDTVRFLSIMPYSGGATTPADLRIKIVRKHFVLLYRIEIKKVRIVQFWDTRRNPELLKKYNNEK